MKKQCIDAINEYSSKMERFAIVTITESTGSSPASVGQNIIIKEDGDFAGTVGGGIVESKIIKEAIECLKNGISKSFEYDLLEIGMSCGGSVKGFIQAPPIDNNLIIIGGGHIGQKLYEIGQHTEFKITLVDDRDEFAKVEKFPNCKVVCCDYSELLNNVKIDENSYVVLVTRGHVTDLTALKQVLKVSPKYIGMIGSRRKTLEVKAKVLEECQDEEMLKNIYAPIGLNIAKNDPAEIAISIFAEILTIKNKGKLEHLKIM